MAPLEKDLAVPKPAFDKWVFNILGNNIPIDNLECWTQPMLAECKERIEKTAVGGKGPSPDVHF